MTIKRIKDFLEIAILYIFTFLIIVIYVTNIKFIFYYSHHNLYLNILFYILLPILILYISFIFYLRKRESIDISVKLPKVFVEFIRIFVIILTILYFFYRLYFIFNLYQYFILVFIVLLIILILSFSNFLPILLKEINMDKIIYLNYLQSFILSCILLNYITILFESLFIKYPSEVQKIIFNNNLIFSLIVLLILFKQLVLLPMLEIRESYKELSEKYTLLKKNYNKFKSMVQQLESINYKQEQMINLHNTNNIEKVRVIEYQKEQLQLKEQIINQLNKEISTINNTKDINIKIKKKNSSNKYQERKTDIESLLEYINYLSEKKGILEFTTRDIWINIINNNKMKTLIKTQENLSYLLSNLLDLKYLEILKLNRNKKPIYKFIK